MPVNLLSRGTTETIESFGVTEMLLNYITFSIFKVASKELTEPGLKNTVLVSFVTSFMDDPTLPLPKRRLF